LTIVSIFALPPAPNGPRLVVTDNPAIENADRITIEAWVNTLSGRTRADPRPADVLALRLGAHHASLDALGDECALELHPATKGRRT
jgi:hypothetical protein